MQNNEKYINLIFKFLTKEITKDESIVLNGWLASDISNKKTFDSYSRTWEISSKNINPEILDINVENEWNIFKTKNNFTQNIKTKKNNVKKMFFLKISSVAAAAVVIILVGLLFLFNTGTETITATNSILETNLSDSTQITLNKHSEIKYNKKFNQKNRQVELSGEAYFNVKHDPNNHFIVKTDKFYVEVIGTEFFVSTLAENPVVVVKQGRVLVYTFEDKSDSIILNVGKRAILNNDKSTFKSEENKDRNYLSWKTQKIIFENDEFEEIVRVIKQTYDVKIVILNPELRKHKLTITFEDQTLESILNVLKYQLNLKIEKKESQIEISSVE